MRTKSNLFSSWSADMRRGSLLQVGDRLGVAVSGGGDSVLLLDFLRQAAPERGLQLTVVHFNHQLRGAESDADEQFVRELAEAAGLEVISSNADVRGVARKSRRNLEAAARDHRYKFFFDLLQNGRLDKIATGHTASDQAETVLLRLLRGTGTRGLGGIYPFVVVEPGSLAHPAKTAGANQGRDLQVRRGIIRPFLNLVREDIRAELAARRLTYRDDSTNSDLHFLRNQIRAELLPLLERVYNPEIVRGLKDLADRARDEEAYLEQQTTDKLLLGGCKKTGNGTEVRMMVTALHDLPPALQRRALRQVLENLQAEGVNRAGPFGLAPVLTHQHIEALRRFTLQSQSGRILSLPRCTAKKEFDWLVLTALRSAGANAAYRESVGETPCGYSYSVKAPGQVKIHETGVALKFEIIPAEDKTKPYNCTGAPGLAGPVRLDPQKLTSEMILRNWRVGDRFRPYGCSKDLKVKELFRRARVPAIDRRLWPVLECGGNIVWVKGFPPASAFAARPGREPVFLIAEESCN
jgi:tRNA(Ile)-lysidine synthase